MMTTLEVLRKCEWFDTGETAPVFATCPCCYRQQCNGHTSVCPLAAAIRREESGGRKALYDAAWAECQAAIQAGREMSVTMCGDWLKAKLAHDALRKEHGL